ncbi:uncharacterized protein METZ01_LOCUS482490 [marine metagenome]|uniref:Uncharacterized protein n=1 Tax=marine metagenome TaxID=408172 RepID=A0A383CB72_9ZZZZ
MDLAGFVSAIPYKFTYLLPPKTR